MITRKLNPRVYDSLLFLLAAVHLYRVYRHLDTLPLYINYELLVSVWKQFNCLLFIVCEIGNVILQLFIMIYKIHSY